MLVAGAECAWKGGKETPDRELLGLALVRGAACKREGSKG